MISSHKIGSRVGKLRRERKMSQADLAEEIGVTKNYVSQIETDRKFPSFSIISKLATVLGVAVSTLVEDDPLVAELRRLIDKNGADAMLATLARVLDDAGRRRR